MNNHGEGFKRIPARSAASTHMKVTCRCGHGNFDLVNRVVLSYDRLDSERRPIMVQGVGFVCSGCRAELDFASRAKEIAEGADGAIAPG